MDRFDGGFESVSSSGPELDTDSNPPPKQPVYTAEMEFESAKIQILIFFKKYQDFVTKYQDFVKNFEGFLINLVQNGLSKPILENGKRRQGDVFHSRQLLNWV